MQKYVEKIKIFQRTKVNIWFPLLIIQIHHNISQTLWKMIIKIKASSKVTGKLPCTLNYLKVQDIWKRVKTFQSYNTLLQGCKSDTVTSNRL